MEMARFGMTLLFLFAFPGIRCDLVGKNCGTPVSKNGLMPILIHCQSKFETVTSCFLPARDCEFSCQGLCPAEQEMISSPCQLTFECFWGFEEG